MAERLSLRRRLALEMVRRLQDGVIEEHPLRQLFWECTLRCNLSCRHCGSDCKAISSVKDMPIEDFLKVLDSVSKECDPHKVMINVTGGEPLMQAEFLREFFRLCKAEGIHTCLDTSGAIFNEKAMAVMEFTDLVMLDIKTLDDSLHKSYTGATRDNNHRWMEYLQENGKPTWIRHVVVPTITDNEERLNALVGYISQYSCIERVELLGYHVMGEAKYQNMHIPYPLHGIPPLQPERLNKIREMFRQKLNIKVL